MAMIHDGDSEALEREEIAIIGMAGRFPGAADVEAFWANLRGGVESTRAFSDAELAAAGVDAAMRARPEFVNSGALADHLDAFDADFFGIGRREAELMDPQHRVLLEVAWEALERAGYDPAATPATIGVFGGVAPNTYRGHVQRVQPTLLQAMGGYIDLITSEREYAITRIAHRLDLRGAAVSVNTACSSSGVALHLACQSLLAGENDLCLVAGARVRVPLTAGYLYTEDGIPSPDGHCRAFDADARGTAIGNGAAAIVLKRLSDARADRDWIHAVVKGTAINNDGAAKVGFTAPGVRGQSAAIAEALAMAEVSADSIGYLEAHGTGTALGDPIEITAATKAFRRTTQRRGFCAVGSVKTNIGHLDAGAGVTGVIKTALALERRELPPSLNFERPNPQIDFASSPFFVNDHLRPWDAGDAPRRAGVSCFGLGGTNAHAVLEEGPARAASAPARRRHQLLVWSARDGAAVERASARLAAHLRDPAGPAADQDLADIAYTLQVGRRHFEQRRALVSGARDEAAAAFGDEPGDALLAPRSAPGDKAVAFLFPGGGAQYVGMGRDLFEHEPVFRAAVEECLGPASVALSVDLLAMLYPTGAASPELVRTSERPSRALPLLFAIEYALAQLWTSWGLRPTAMIGHSMGEYTAACLAGVVTVGDGMRIVLERGRLFEQLAPGAMLSVALPPDDARLVGAPLCAAAINRPGSCVLSGPVAAIEELQRALAADGVDCTRVHISVAAHSAMVEPILNAFGAFMGTIPLRKPEIPYVSNVTGEWIQAHEVTDPQYWVRHLRQTVRFADGLTTLLGRGGCVLLEVGPGQTLSTFARQHPDAGRGHAVVASMRHPRETAADDVFALRALGRAYVEGVAVDWQGFAAAEVRGRVPLPTYPFARERHWIDGVAPLSETPAGPPAPTQAPAAAEPRQRRVRAGLAEAVHELTGQAPAQIDPHASFLELGFDSLLLTQAGSAFRARFGVPVSFRQLFEQTPNLDRLATYIDERLPADALPPPAAPLPIDAEDPGAGPAGVGSVDGVTALERVIRDQMQLMREQLAMLRGDTTTAPPAAAVSMADAPMAAAPWAGTPLTGAAPVDGGGLVSSTTAVVHGPWNPPERGAGAVLTPTQQRHLDALIERFTARTRRSKEWTQQHRARLADPRTAAGFRRQWKELVYPIVADRAQGSKLWDLDGNEWLDISMGFGVTVFGHSPDFVIEAVRERLDLGMAIGPQTTLAGDVAELLCELTGFERAALCNTGSEAVLAAIRAARTVSGRDAIVMFTNSYHGMFDEVVVRGLPAAAGATPRAVPLAPGIPRGAVEQVIVLEYGAPESLDIIAAHADRIAAVLVEPVQSRDPECQPREFVVDLRRLTADRGIALVFDEMVTGFRLHQGGAQAHYGVEADLGTFGKVVGGGMPIGVVAGTARYLDALDGGHWQFGDDSVPEAGVTWFAGTFVRHPLALAAAKAALQRLADQGPELQETLNARTLQMRDEANAWFEAEDLPVRLRGFASHFLILPSAAADGELEYASLYFHYLRDRGIHCHERRPHFLTLAHSDEDLAWLQCALREAALEMRAAGFFPPAGGNAVILPLTEAQQEIWLASRLDDDASRAFHLSAAMDLRGTLDRRALDAAIAALPRCHEALRLRIAADGEHQEVLPGSAAPLPFAEHDLRALARESRGARLAELQRADVEEPFDLETGPLLRLRLMVLGDAHYHLVLTAHHVVCDGWSMGILMRDLGALYAAAEGGGAASLPAPPGLQFSAYARDLQHRLEGPSGAAAKAHWLDSLAGELPVLDLP
ncbi:MAG: aminotransferase class III-fold pyridoxal phosphate-dependent enzyme, partial [Planctomycetota bacterium]